MEDDINAYLYFMSFSPIQQEMCIIINMDFHSNF